MNRSKCSLLFNCIVAACVASALGNSYNKCIPPPDLKPNPYNNNFIGIQGKILSQKDDVHGVIWKLGICGQTSCSSDKTDGMLTQEVPGFCYTIGKVGTASPWSLSKDGNYVLTTLPYTGSGAGCDANHFRTTALEFVCDENADANSMSFTVETPAEGETACGAYHVKLKTCLACSSSRFGKCAQKPTPGPAPKPSPAPAPKPSPAPAPKPSPGPTPKPSPRSAPTPSPDDTKNGIPWYLFVVVGAVVMGAVGFYVFRSRFDTSSTQGGTLNSGLLKQDAIADEYTPPAIVEDA